MGADPRQRRIDVLFTRALELPAAERDGFVAAQCRGDPELERSVKELLAGAQSPEEDLATPVDALRNELLRALGPASESPEENLSGRRFGHWRLERPLARGGLATVYLARRDDEQFEQTVAFKVLRRGLDTDDLIARFRIERQILSNLEHPAIVQILDGGALPDGRPYLVLEYVDGLPITEHCDRHRIDIRGRLGLIVDVLRALHHAHRHLVVHRDVKPSNILVTAEGNVALLDFGIAKLLDDEAMGGSSPRTRTGVSLLTPGYASPEQQRGQLVTTASDLYQVGIVLYELLAGKRPDLAHGPPPPSRAVEDRARVRIRGDLDAIVTKAMHPDPAARYGSAGEMEADLGRFLDGRPVAARPDGLGYRFSKLIRRRPWLLPAAALAVLATGIYLATLISYNRQLRLEQQRATAAQEFMVELLKSADPFAPADPERGRNITVVEAIDLGRERIRSELAGQPELQASLLASVASIYQSLGQHAEAIELRGEALELERRLYGDHSAEVIDGTRFLAEEYAAIGDAARADSLYRSQLALARRVHDPDSPEVGVAEAALGAHLSAQGNLTEGAEVLDAGIAKMWRSPERFSRALLNAIVTRAARLTIEPPEDFVAILLRARELADRVYGPDSLLAGMVRAQLGSTYSAADDYAAAEANFLAAVEIHDARLGRAHNASLSILNNLSIHYQRMDRPGEAERLLREILDRYLALYGENHRQVATSYQNLATAITRQGRFDESLPLHRKAYDIYRRVLEDDNYVIAFPLLSIAYAELKRDRIAPAERAAAEALERIRSGLAGTSVEGVAQCLVALVAERRGDSVRGTERLDHAHAMMRKGPVSETYRSFCRLPAD